MSRDIENYEVFQLAHSLVLKIYRITQNFPSEEKFGLVLQMRRSAYSIPMNLNEKAKSQKPIAKCQSGLNHEVGLNI